MPSKRFSLHQRRGTKSRRPKYHLDRITEERRSENMRRIRSKDTAPELIVRRLVHSIGFRYRLHDHKLPGRPDLVFRRLKRVIQVHGCFWHGHEGCPGGHLPTTRREYWEPKLERNKARDEENKKRLRELGWRSLTIWECETRKTKVLTRRLKAFLTKPALVGL